MQDQVPPDTPSSDPLKLPEHVLDALPGVLFVVGADGVTEFCGSAVIDVMGFSAAEFVATPGLWWQCLHPEDVRRIKKAFSEGTDKPRLGFDYRFQRKDGRYRWLRSELRRRILPDGTFSRELIGFTTDIEESIQREAARRKMEIERMRTERTLETVSKIQQRMLHATSVAELYSEACQTLVKDGYYQWVVITEPKNSDEVCFSAVTHQAGRSGLATTQGQSDGQSATFDPASSWTDQTGQFFAGACGVSIPLQTSSEPFACLSIKTAGSEILLPQEVGLLEQLASDMAMVRDSIIQREALQRSERWFRVLFESATIGILVHDPQTVDLLEVNPKAMEDLGVASVSEIRPGAFFGESPYSLVEMKQWFRKTREQGPQRFEWLVTRHDGSQRWHDTSLQYVKLDGHARILAMAIDITERKIAEESLRQLNNLLEERVVERTRELTIQAAAMDATLDGMAILRDQKFIYMNPSHATLYGYQPDELIGKCWTELYTDDVVGYIRSAVGPTVTNSWQSDLVARRKDGSAVDVELTLTKISDSDSVCVVRNISERKQSEEDRRKAHERVNEANRILVEAVQMKDQFLANVSHELRTPLTGILGMAEVLSDSIGGSGTPRQKEALSVIQAGGEHLLAVINDILDLARVQGGALELDCTDCSVDLLCRDSLAIVRGLAEKKMQDIRYEISESKLSCYADPVRVKQILVNLLGNAIKFTPGGGTVGLEASLIMDDRAVQFTVWDTGCGIEPEDQLRIFRPFTQLDHGLSRRHAGTGLGLTLVRQFVEMHGGTVRVESQVGAGSRFTLTLPRDIRTEGISETGRPTRAEGILVANS